ncbi:MAG: tRNA threonylcarbamoyladenosine dehydratase [Flavobacteriaceae bacterium]|nr:tRNA threonylcarbamoyladenosine dehydratase [Flavobacteriaceae bacterium]
MSQEHWLERTELLIGNEGINALQKAHILIVGLGGVGSFAAEFIARSGVGNLTIVDTDTVDTTNINRQLPALNSTIGVEKTSVMAQRIKDINPNINLTVINEFLSPERAYEIVSKEYDYIIDCIDSISPKVQLLVGAKRKKVKIISCMGAGGKVDVTKIKIRDISKTRDCYLAKQIRIRLRKQGILKGIRAVFSEELPKAESLQRVENVDFKKSYYGTISYMPACFGLFAAAEVIQYLIDRES